MSSTTIGSILFVLLFLLALLLHLPTCRRLFLPPRAVASTPSARTPKPLKPGTPDLCPPCRDEAHHVSLTQCLDLLTRSTPPPWSQVKGHGGPHKHLDSGGRYCTNFWCPYFGITDPAIHALVGDGHYPTAAGPRQNWVCACCGQPVADTYGCDGHLLHPPYLVGKNRPSRPAALLLILPAKSCQPARFAALLHLYPSERC